MIKHLYSGAAKVLIGLILIGHVPAVQARDTTDSSGLTASRQASGSPDATSRKEVNMKTSTGFARDIETLTTDNTDFRHVLFTSKHMQLVLMALKPGEDIGAETHATVDQFLRIEEGAGEVTLDGVTNPVRAGYAILVPAGTKHNLRNTGKTPMKLYTLYGPPNHRDGVVHHTRAEAEKDNEHFDGNTTH